ncbi:MAG: hypothetical protein KAR20_23110, partial [Candidatus Heimdallarchaeota archaeon]|nr:hypothetical protein [Candidatus Heimdallarchaeota archaeon]
NQKYGNQHQYYGMQYPVPLSTYQADFTSFSFASNTKNNSVENKEEKNELGNQNSTIIANISDIICLRTSLNTPPIPLNYYHCKES